MKPLILTVGNIYIDLNIFGIDSSADFTLVAGKEYAAIRSERVLGGSAVNAAMQLLKLGIDVGFIGKIGADAGANEIKNLLETEGILCDLMCEDASKTTSMAVNLILKNGEFIGIHYGDASKTLAAEDINLNRLLFARSQAVYFGGTAKQSILFKECGAVFRTLSERGIKVFYDPNRFPAEEALADSSLMQAQLAYVEGYFPNEEELLQATSKSNIDEALDQVLSSGVKFVALKRGAQGCRVKTHGDDFAIEGKQVKAITTVGAGDCFNATFIAYYLRGESLKVCAERANAAAAIKVSQNILPDVTEIESFE